MKETKLALSERGLNESLLPRLRGRVFYLTLLSNLERINQAGEIRPNSSGAYPGPLSHYNSFFKNRGCVCLFDYRTVSEDKLNISLGKCSPATWIGFSPGSGLAIFLLARDRCPDLLPWTLWEEQEAWREMVVPHVEAGHEGPISLELIDEVLCVEVEPDDHPLVVALRAREGSGPTD